MGKANTVVSSLARLGPPGAGERPLDPVRRFLNTARKEEGLDRLADPADAEAWFAEQGYGAVRPSARRLTQYRSVRELIRLVLLGDASAVAELDRVLPRLTSATPGLAVGAGGEVTAGLRPAAVAGEVAPLQLILMALWRAAGSGELERLKVCADERCRLAFYDRSRNRSRAWCTGGECGNRNRVARHRARRSAGGPASGPE
jgi:predicted RNA-binding Zn ribbon-like protein